ncbi:MAG: hypothetical protein ACI4TI_03160 [Christensenellales bacterium]
MDEEKVVVEENIFYLEAKQNLDNFILREFPDFSKKLQNHLVNFIPSMGNYEEEGVKYRPVLLFTNDINAIAKAVPNAYKVPLFNDESEALFSQRMKSLSVFCKNDWCIYIQQKENMFQYGIIKSTNSIKERNFQALVGLSETLKEKTKVFSFFVYALNSYTIRLKSKSGNKLNINFSLETKKITSWTEEISEFVDASFSKLRTTKKKLGEVKTMYYNIFDRALKNITGAICVVVDKDYVDKGFLSDGIWLDEPIEFSKLFLQTKSFNEQKLLAASDLFISMLNYDGITVIDNLGRIRAYNCFVETSMNNEKNLLGGARKRAAYTIINTKIKKIVGVYFQSHEGEMFYIPVRKNKGKI